MLDFYFNRRDFLRMGSIGTGMSTLGLSDLVLGSEEDLALKDKTVVWLWLGGGATQFETFHAPTDFNVADQFRPVNGLMYDSDTNLCFGADWLETFKHKDKLVSVNSFTHGDSSHRQATHWMMTGHYNGERAQTSLPKYPAFGSIISSIYGSNSSTGVPTYVQQGGISGDGPAWLGGAYKPFNPSNKDNLSPRVAVNRFKTRGDLLAELDRHSQIVSQSANSVDKYTLQAYDTILGTAKLAFDIDKESKKTKAAYGDSAIGKQLLLARRLAEYGTKFVTMHYGGWDMHSNISNALKGRVPPVDKAIAAFLEDVWEKGLNEKILLVVTGEFGRTKLNGSGGRDHWPAMSPMLMAGGEYELGRTIGKADKSYTPKENPCGPLDVCATLFDHFNIPMGIQKVDTGGRPRYLLEGEGKVIL